MVSGSIPSGVAMPPIWQLFDAKSLEPSALPCYSFVRGYGG